MKNQEIKRNAEEAVKNLISVIKAENEKEVPNMEFIKILQDSLNANLLILKEVK